MSQTYYALLTATGEAKLANAAARNTPLQLKQMAVGDGGGSLPMPSRSQTALVGEWYRAPLNNLTVDVNNPNQVIAELIVPASQGGRWIREMGLYDGDGNLVAVANTPPSYKPQLDEGSGRTQVLRLVLIVANTATVELKIDTSTVMATRQYVDDAITVAVNRLDFKQSVRVASTVNLTLSGIQTVDGIALVVGDRVLVKNQDNSAQNGLYVVALGTWPRASDADANPEVTPGLLVAVEEGNLQGDTFWKLITDAPIAVGTTALAFTDITSGYAPLKSPDFSGDPRAPTPPRFDNDKSLANTEFVKAMGLEFSAVKEVTVTGATLMAEDAGKVIRLNLPASGTGSPTNSVVLPPLSALPGAAALLLKNVSSSSLVMVTPAGADILPRPLTLPPLCSALLVARSGTAEWLVSAGSAETVDALASGIAGQWSFRNKLINGNFDYWQRGTSFSASGYCADRWRIETISNVAVNQGIASPPFGKFSMLMTPKAATNELSIAQVLDSSMALTLAGKKATFSFQANSGAYQTITAYIQKSTVANQAIIASGWTTIVSKVFNIGPGAQVFSITADIPNDGTAAGLRVAFAFNNSANGVGIVIWGCQLEEGAVATPFEFRQNELSLCQIYYETGNFSLEVYGAAGNYNSYWHSFKATKRVIPTMTLSATSQSPILNAPYPSNASHQGWQPRAKINESGQGGFYGYFAADSEI